jgi:hypothetical protein
MGADFTFQVDEMTYGNGKVEIGDMWFNNTCDMTLTAFNSQNWTNYTVTGAGTQEIYNGTKPNAVWINGVNTTEGAGWTYANGIVTVTTATSIANLYWGTATSTPASSSVLSFSSFKTLFWVAINLIGLAIIVVPIAIFSKKVDIVGGVMLVVFIVCMNVALYLIMGLW